MTDKFFDKKYLDFRFDVLMKGDVNSCLSVCGRVLRCKRILSRLASFEATLDVPGLVIYISMRSRGHRIRESIETADKLIKCFPEPSRSLALDHARCILNMTQGVAFSEVYTEADREWVSARHLLEAVPHQ